MLGAEIIVASAPRGIFVEGIMNGTPYPGVLMTQVLGVSAAVGQGRFQWQPGWSGANGDPRLVCILVNDVLQGQYFNVAYVTGVRCFMYVPYPGEEMNILLAGEAGTGSTNAFTVGERLIAQYTNGEFILESTSSFIAPFMSQEHLDEVPDTATLLWTMRQ